MSIRIVPKEQLGKEPSEKSISLIPPVLFPNLKNLYQRRAERFQALAKDNPFADYLEFAAEIALAQEKALHDNPLELDLTPLLSQQTGIAPLDKKAFKRSKHWHALLASIIAELQSVVPESAKIALENLSKASETELEEMATALLNDEYSKVSADKSVFIWAALSLY